jgi:hypothetical protein
VLALVVATLGEMHRKFEVSTVSWSGGNTEYSSQKGWRDPANCKIALGGTRRWPESDIEDGCLSDHPKKAIFRNS